MMMTEGVEAVVIRAYYPFRQLNELLVRADKVIK